MNIIITMAGQGSRFKKVGYDIPKYMIEANGKTLFEWSMESLIDYNKYTTKYIFVVRKEDNARDFIINKCNKYNINNINILEIDYLTDGQASTCMLAIPSCNLQEEIMVYNIDTYIEPGGLKYDDIVGDGYIPCFKDDGEHWSFVKTDNRGKAIEIREKNRISDNCSLGAYYFKSAKLYKDLYEKYYNNEQNLEKNEKYIAPIYNYMISKGYEVNISIIENDKVHVLGTPEELGKFINSELKIK